MHAPAPVQFAILGPLDVRREGEEIALRGGRLRALLLMLLLRPNVAVSAERLIDQLWGDAPPARAANALHVLVSRLRRTLGVGGDLPLVTVPVGYLLRVEPGALDAAVFEAGVEDARRALAAGRAPEAADTLWRVLGLWRGPALADCAYDAFAQADIARFEELRLAALEELMDAELAQGHTPVAELERLVAEHPLRERVRAQLMLALHHSGRQAEALETYRTGREMLMDELGLEPSPALRRLEIDILRRAPSVAGIRSGAPLPEPLRNVRAHPLVGRARELGALRAALDGPGPRVILVSGDAGMGKTRMLAELAGEAHAAGTTVLYGRADEGNPIPFQPVVEALRGRPLDALDGFEPELAALAGVAPELRPRADERAPALCAALSVLVGEVARSEPTLLVLDDLQWADRATLLLLRHLVHAAPLAMLGAVRDGERDDGLAELIAELHGERRLWRVRLDGLDEAAIRALAPAFAGVLWHATGGNPFLVEELLRHRDGQRLTIPESVHALFERRLGRVDGPTREVLGAAAVIGAEFGLERLEAVAGAGDEIVLAALEQALAARLVEDVAGDGTRYRFVPPLLRDAIAVRIGSARRMRTQRRIAAALRCERRAA